MKAEEIRELDESGLTARLGELQEEEFKLRFASATMQLENPKIFSGIRRDIARIKTILRERELASTDS